MIIIIPLNSVDIDNGIEKIKETSLSYKIKAYEERIQEYVNGIDAVRQAVYKILMTERYKYEIYDWNYGIELNDLFGKNSEFVKGELSVRIEDALCADDRIDSVYDFYYWTDKKGSLCVRFYVKTIYGDFDFEWEADFNCLKI